MKNMPRRYINIKGELMDLSSPCVMGILNVTPDSFYSQSRYNNEQEIARRATEIISQGAAMIDIGAYSTRPGCEDISPDAEMERLAFALDIINREVPGAVISVDTFRADVAKQCVLEHGAAIINDISGGQIDKAMFEAVAELNVPYILMHMRGTPQTMSQFTHYDDFMGDILLYFSQKINKLHRLGVNDIILDPGFGFSKTLDQNYTLMKHIGDFGIFDMPVLSGISRKSMIYKLFGTSPEESLNGTSILNTYSLMGGANILRVHDVKEAVEAVTIFNKLQE